MHDVHRLSLFLNLHPLAACTATSKLHPRSLAPSCLLILRTVSAHEACFEVLLCAGAMCAFIGERTLERGAERALERAGERALERAGERALERAGERLWCAVTACPGT
jgi:hypothetical protein